jgi:hypothetical protein
MLRVSARRSQGVPERPPAPLDDPAERRRAVRFHLEVPVIIGWIDPSGEKKEELGRIRDISILGAFVVCQAPLAAQTAISLEVYLPPLERNTHQQLRLKGSGNVTRTSPDYYDGGFAATIKFVLEETCLASEAC